MALWFAASLLACGQKGDLYLPDAEPDEEEAAASSADPA